MKTTFKFIIAAMAASAVFASCQKELATGNPSEPTDGVRVISASFSAPTKSDLGTDGKTPKFVGGETIKVSNATASQNCTINVNDGVATFSTTLTGELTAVYPSSAAKMIGNIIDQTAVLVSTYQDGTFANANIAMATGITTSATFTNKTAVIAITPGAGSNSNYVEVITAGPQIANTTSPGYNKFNKIHVNVNSATTYPVYVSILVPEGLRVRDLSFADGHNIKTVKDNTAAIAVNTHSTVSSTGWDTPYVEIAGKKWATMNIGASNEFDAGKYFAWGDVVGQTWTGSAWDGGGFLSAPNIGGNPATLPLEYDAANVNWGGSWRMPTSAEFDALALVTREWVDSPVLGYKFGTFPNTIFLPVAGWGYGTGIDGTVGIANYWSSSLDTGNLSYASYFYFVVNGGGAYTGGYDRRAGQSVRALSE